MITKDNLVLEFINNPLYNIKKDGTILTRIAKTGKIFVDPNKWREAGTTDKDDGYRHIGYRNKKLQIHRIIYAKFLAGRNNNPELSSELVINHKNGITSDNRIENLELVTVSENNIHSYQVLKNGAVMGNSKFTWEIIRAIRKEYKELKTPYKILMQKYNVSKGNLSEIINNKIWIENHNYHPNSL